MGDERKKRKEKNEKENEKERPRMRTGLSNSLSSMSALPGVQGYPLFRMKRLLSVRGGGGGGSQSSASFPSSSLSTSLDNSGDMASQVTIRLVAAAGVKNYSLMALYCSNGMTSALPLFLPFSHKNPTIHAFLSWNRLSDLPPCG